MDDTKEGVGERTFVEGIPNWNVFVVSADHECCVVKIVVYDSRIRPGAVRVEKCERGIWKLLAFILKHKQSTHPNEKG
jgi:hypothetical protein